MEKSQTIEQLMSLIQTDLHGYFFTIDHEANVDIEFGRGIREWILRDRDTKEETKFSINQAVQLFHKHQVDIFKVHLELVHHIGIALQSARAKIDRANELFGKAEVKKMIQDWEIFTDTLLETIEDTVRRSRIKLVKD